MCAAVQNQGKARGSSKPPRYKRPADLGRMAEAEVLKKSPEGSVPKCTKTWEMFSKTLLPIMRINTKTRAKQCSQDGHTVSCSVTLIPSKSQVE